MSGGAWIQMTDEDMLGKANGVATLDANSKVAQNIPNSKVEGLGSLALKNSLTAAEVGARPSNWMPTAAEVGARASDWIPTVAEIPKLPQSKITDLTEDLSSITTDLASKVPNTLTVNGRPLSSDITLTTEDVKVAKKTSLPETGQPGQIISVNGTLYIWKG